MKIRFLLFALMALSLIRPRAQTFAQATDATNHVTDTSLESLQGTWQGEAGPKAGQKITIAIAGHSLRYQGQSTNDWYEVTFTLPADTVPQELRATITACQQTNDIGTVVRAIFKIEHGTLTLVGIQDRDKEPPKRFTNDKPPVAEIADSSFNFVSDLPGVTDASKAFENDSTFRYELRKVQPQKMKMDESTVK